MPPSAPPRQPAQRKQRVLYRVPYNYTSFLFISPGLTHAQQAVQRASQVNESLQNVNNFFEELRTGRFFLNAGAILFGLILLLIVIQQSIASSATRYAREIVTPVRRLRK